ncbi:MAG: hypothetical protein IIC71_10985 [Acidobacteria bacterium]|nr:hypothetical protein [Acidobacteriota bacterium]
MLASPLIREPRRLDTAPRSSRTWPEGLVEIDVENVSDPDNVPKNVYEFLTCASSSLNPDALRGAYRRALQRADSGDITELVAFART